MNIDTREITLEPADNARLLSLCGPFDDNIKQLERRLGIEINRRDNHFKLTGRPICVTAAADILRSLYVDTAPMRGQIQDIEPEQIHLAIKEREYWSKVRRACRVRQSGQYQNQTRRN
ncbi:hypothetical protein ACVXG8_01485 [Escherichia coli]